MSGSNNVAVTMTGALALAVMGLGAAHAATPITIDDTGVFPESMTATASGDLIVGSSAKGAIYRAKAGASKAELWIDPKTSGISGLLGVFADDKTQTLYACSAALGAPPGTGDALSALRLFDLRTGAAKAAYPMPGGAKALCNDIAIGAGGAAGEIVELQPSVKLGGPDGLRSIGGLRFLQAENQVGRISLVTVSGTTATVTPLKEGEPGVTAMALVKGQVWAINAKMAYRRDPALKDKDPNPFLVEPVGALPQ